MTLLDIRKRFVQISGRYDLVIDAVDYADNGADAYINDGLRWLDRRLDMPETQAKLYFPLAVGEYAITFQHSCRYITEVWVNDDESRFELTKYTLRELKTLYPSLASATTQDTPMAFAIAELRALETTERDSLGTFINKTWAEDDTKYDYRGIIIVPPADKSYIVEIAGMFKNVALSLDADENFWTQEEPDILTRAALYKLEAFSRGTENAKNWLSALQDDIIRLDQDVAAEEAYGINQLRG